MSRGRLPAASTVVVLAVLCLGLLAFAPTAGAQESTGYVVEQGEQCIDVDPVVDESRTVEEFYDYSNDTYVSQGTLAYQEDNTSLLILYEGAQGTSLVVVHERYHDPYEEGTNGSSATFTVTGIDPGDGWAVEDDNYEGQDDEFYHGDTSSEMNWVWGQGRTDGGAYRGLDGDFEVGIDPAFNEAANKRYDNVDEYAGQVEEWKVVSESDGETRTVALNSLSESVTISPGQCDTTPVEAALDVSETEPQVGETTVTLDASGTSGDVEEYRWDLTGDGATDRTSTDAVIEHVFEEPGERDVTVTAVTADGRSDAAAETVTPRDTTPPTSGRRCARSAASCRAG